MFITLAHLSHTQPSFSINLSIITQQLLCVNSLHWVHHMEFLTIHFLHIDQGYFSEENKFISVFLLTRSLIFVKLTLNLFDAGLCIHMWNFFSSSTLDFAERAKPLVYSSFHLLILNSSVMVSKTNAFKRDWELNSVKFLHAF